MAMNPFKERGISLDKQIRNWKQIALRPYPKQKVDAYTRTRIILMNGIENEGWFFKHSFARNTDNMEIKAHLAETRRIEQQQQTTINWLNPPDQTVLETSIAYEQVAIDLTAYLARTEPDPYVKEVFDFGLLEDFDHMFRFAQMLDLVEGKDPEEITQGRTTIFPGRPTQDHHNDPILRLRKHYEKNQADPISKANILTLLSAEQQTYLFYKEHGFQYGSPDLRELYAEIGEVEEEHVTQYESLMDPNETWFEKLLLHEFVECANYYTCYTTEEDPNIKTIWEMFLAFELEHLRIAGEMIKKYEKKDPEEIVGTTLPTPGKFEENKDYVADVLINTVDKRLMPDGAFARINQLPKNWPSYSYQRIVNAAGSPSEEVVRLRMESAGVELVRASDDLVRRTADIRLSLDAEKAPNTAPEMAEQVKPQYVARAA